MRPKPGKGRRRPSDGYNVGSGAVLSPRNRESQVTAEHERLVGVGDHGGREGVGREVGSSKSMPKGEAGYATPDVHRMLEALACVRFGSAALASSCK